MWRASKLVVLALIARTTVGVTETAAVLRPWLPRASQSRSRPALQVTRPTPASPQRDGSERLTISASSTKVNLSLRLGIID
jgi:hypothetical protein